MEHWIALDASFKPQYHLRYLELPRHACYLTHAAHVQIMLAGLIFFLPTFFSGYVHPSWAGPPHAGGSPAWATCLWRGGARGVDMAACVTVGAV